MSLSAPPPWTRKPFSMFASLALIRSLFLPSIFQVRWLVLHLSSRVGGEEALRSLVQKHAPPRVGLQLSSVLQGVLDFSDSGDDELLYGPSLLPSRNQLPG